MANDKNFKVKNGIDTGDGIGAGGAAVAGNALYAYGHISQGSGSIFGFGDVVAGLGQLKCSQGLQVQSTTVIDSGRNILNINNISATGDLTLAKGTTAKQAYHDLYIGGNALDSADSAIYIGNAGNGGGYGWELFYNGAGGGNLNKFIIRSENLGSPVDALSFNQDGAATFGNTIAATGGNSTNWNTAYSWGDHASAGYFLASNYTNVFKSGAEIPGSQDLNTYRTTGYYSQDANADATSGSNYPVLLAGILEVITGDQGNGLQTEQRYSQYNTNDKYVRHYYNGNWTSWAKQWTSANDGIGSGLDADLLDGQHGSYYAAASSLGGYLPLTGGTLTGTLYLRSSGSYLSTGPGVDQNISVGAGSTGSVYFYSGTSSLGYINNSGLFASYFGDKDNTAYYLDPSNDTTSLVVKGDALSSNNTQDDETLFAITDADTTNSVRRKFKNDSTAFTKVDDPDAPASGVFEVAGTYNTTWGDYIPMDDESEITFECWAKHISGTDNAANFYAGSDFYDGNQSGYGNTQRYWGANGDAQDSDNTTWRHIKGVMKGSAIRGVLTDASYLRFLTLFNYNGAGNTTRFCGFKFYRSKKTVSSLWLRTHNGAVADDSGWQSTEAATSINIIDNQGNIGAGRNANPLYSLYADGHIAQASGSIYGFGDVIAGLGFLKSSQGLQVQSTIVIDSGLNLNNIANINATSGTITGAFRVNGGSYSSGIDTSTVGIAIDRGDYIFSDDGSYLRRILGHTAGGVVEVGQGGTGLINSINLLPGNAGNSAANVNGNTIWNAGNDGSGSGLDADLLDGQHGSYYAPATGGSYLPLSGGTLTGTLYFNSTQAYITRGPGVDQNLSIGIGTGGTLYIYEGPGLGNNIFTLSATRLSAYSRIYTDPGTSETASTPNWESRAQGSGNGVTQYHANFTNSTGTVNGRITSNNFSTTYATTSDYRVKEDLQEMGEATSRLLQLNPINFKWIGSEERTDGFLAHEVKLVVADAVVGEKDATETVTEIVSDIEGTESEIIRTVPSLQALDQSKLIPLLVKTVQEQQALISSLEARITALETA